MDTSGQGIIFRFGELASALEPCANNEAERLAAKALVSGHVSEAQLLALSKLLPDEDRVRESEDYIPGQRSFTTRAYSHHGKAGLLFPAAVETDWEPISRRAIHFVGLFPSASAYKDTTNGKHDNLLLACSSFEDGGLWLEDPAGDVCRQVHGRNVSGRVLRWSEGRISFDPHLWHATEKWSGTRLVLAAYSISQAELLGAEDRRRLVDLDFSLPGPKKRGADQIDAPEGQHEVEDLTHDQIASGCEGPWRGTFGSTDEFVDGFGRCSRLVEALESGAAFVGQGPGFCWCASGEGPEVRLDSIPDLPEQLSSLLPGSGKDPSSPKKVWRLCVNWFDMLPDPLRARVLIPHQPFYLRAHRSIFPGPRRRIAHRLSIRKLAG